MTIKPLIVIASIGILIGLFSVYIYNEKVQSQPPVGVSHNPYAKGIYATGIVESYQTNGSNVNIFPEVSGKIINIFVQNRQILKIGDPILAIDDSIQREIVEKDLAQIQYAEATLVSAQDQLTKIQKSYCIDNGSVSKNTLDNAINAVKIDIQSVNVAKAQYLSDKALLDRYVIRSPINGLILRVVPALGDYASPIGSYDTYTQSMLPTIQMGVVTPYLEVRCFVDEILVPRLPPPSKLVGTLFIRGERNKSIPLEFVNLQPYAIPNIQLSDERLQRVDVRVLPIIFRFKKPKDINIYPGLLVDIYIKGKK